jgi:hypothetical protein
MKKTYTLLALLLLATMPLAAQTWNTTGNTIGVKSGTYFGSSNATDIDIRTAATTRMIIGSSGKITMTDLAGSGNRLLQTSATAGLTPFAMSTASNVLCGDGSWRPLNAIPSSQWITSGTHLYSGNTGSVGIGVNPSTVTDAAKLSVIGDLEKTTSYSYSNHATDLKINSIIKVNRENAIAISVQNTNLLGTYQRMPLTIFGDGRLQFSTAGTANTNKEIISIKQVVDPITNYLPGGRGDLNSLFYVTEGGNVGINTEGYIMPIGYKLAVNGKIICTELIVKLRANWPDYVFSNDYKLKDLNELENYITTNKHLPNIPSAQEVAEKGFETGDIIKRQMEKIEELSLYLIQQNKQIAEQKKQLDMQAKQAMEQEKRLQTLESKMK